MDTKNNWFKQAGKAVFLGAGAFAAVVLLTGCPPADEPGETTPAPQEEPVNPPQ